MLLSSMNWDRSLKLNYIFRDIIHLTWGDRLDIFSRKLEQVNDTIDKEINNFILSDHSEIEKVIDLKVIKDELITSLSENMQNPNSEQEEIFQNSINLLKTINKISLHVEGIDGEVLEVYQKNVVFYRL